MGAWGLLKGLGDGMSFAGQKMVENQEQTAKEARLEKYRQAQVDDERQYQEERTAEGRQYAEGQAKETIARSISETRDGILYESDVNAKGEKIGAERSKGKAPVSRDHLVPISRNGGLYDAETGRMIHAPAGAGAGGPPSVKTAKIKDADGNEVLMERLPDGNWKPITQGEEKAAGPRGAFQPPTEKQVKAASEFIKSLGKEAEARDLDPEEQKALAAARQVTQDAFNPPKLGTDRNPLIGVTAEDLPNLRPGTIVVDPEGNLRRVPDRQTGQPAAAPAAAPPTAQQKDKAPKPAGLLQPDLKLPQPKFQQGLQGDKAKAAYEKAAGEITKFVKERVKYEGLQNVSEEQLRMALAGNLSAKERAAVVKELTNRGAK